MDLVLKLVVIGLPLLGVALVVFAVITVVRDSAPTTGSRSARIFTFTQLAVPFVLGAILYRAGAFERSSATDGEMVLGHALVVAPFFIGLLLTLLLRGNRKLTAMNGAAATMFGFVIYLWWALTGD